MSDKKTASMTTASDQEAKGGGTQTPGPKAEIPTFEDTAGVKQYSDDDDASSEAVTGGTQTSGPKAEIPTFEDTAGVKQYSDDD